jgi:hypothetical protein
MVKIVKESGIWTMYNIYEIFYLIAVYKPAAGNIVWSS